jgi:hypothetical protein
MMFSHLEHLKLHHQPQGFSLSFLATYMFWSLMVVLSSLCAKGRWYAPALKDGGPDARTPNLSPVQVAYLASGPIGAVRSSTLVLIHEGNVEARPHACKNQRVSCLLRAVAGSPGAFGHKSLNLSKQADAANEGGDACSMEHRFRAAVMEAIGEKNKEGHVDLLELSRGTLQELLNEIQQGHRSAGEWH